MIVASFWFISLNITKTLLQQGQHSFLSLRFKARSHIGRGGVVLNISLFLLLFLTVVGAGGNTFSTLRRNIGTNRLAFNALGNILTPIDPTPIEVRQFSDGRVDVIIPGIPEPHLTYRDKSPLLIKYISFSTFGNTPARWFYDCKTDHESNNIAVETKKLTIGERLQKDLFTNYSVYAIPENLREIKFSFKIMGVSYDEQRSILKTRIELGLTWQDKKLQWTPEEYDNTNVIHTNDLSSTVYHWTPTILIKNGADYSYHDFNPTYMGIIFSNGTIRIRSAQEVVYTWCIDGSYNWPYDNVQCNIILSAGGNAMNLIHDNTPPMDNQKPVSELSQWHLMAITVLPANVKKEESVNYRNKKTFHNDLVIRLNLNRNQLFCHRIFFTPIVVACLIVLFSFCMDGVIRGGLNLFAVLITALTFIMLAKYAPLTYVPRLVHLYEIVLLTSSLTYILHIVIEWLEHFPPSSEPPQWILAIIHFSHLRLCLGIQFVDVSSIHN